MIPRTPKLPLGLAETISVYSKTPTKDALAGWKVISLYEGWKDMSSPVQDLQNLLADTRTARPKAMHFPFRLCHLEKLETRNRKLRPEN